MTAFKEKPLERRYGDSLYHSFVLLPGPSLTSMDLSPLRKPGVFTAGINRTSFVFRPNLFVMCDSWSTFAMSVWLDPNILKIVRTRNDELWARLPNTYVVDWKTQAEPAEFFEGDKIPQSFAGDSIAASSMIAVMCVLARLGCRRMYLVGADFHMTRFKQYCVPCTPRTDAEVNGENRLFKKLRECFSTILTQTWEDNDFKLYNCTPGSKFTEVPFLPLHEAVEVALDTFPEPKLEWSYVRAEVSNGVTTWPMAINKRFPGLLPKRS